VIESGFAWLSCKHNTVNNSIIAMYFTLKHLLSLYTTSNIVRSIYFKMHGNTYLGVDGSNSSFVIMWLIV